jgi:hypothetical protein
VKVQIVDSLPADLSTTTDESGRFSLTGTFTAGRTTIRLSKQGYATVSLILPPESAPRASIALSLPLLTPPVISPGDYALTFVADSTCNLPEAARTRSYSVPIASPPGIIHLGTFLSVTLRDPSVLINNDEGQTSASFTARAAGDYIVLNVDVGYGDPITERLAPATYLELMGSAAGSVGASGVSPISFDGTFTYCVNASDVTRWPACRVNDAITTAKCTSNNHRVILRRR